MTDITDEQRAAVDWLLGVALGGYSPAEVDHAAALLAALPSDLTNPQPALPTEPGLYVGPGGTGEAVWRFDPEDGKLYNENGYEPADPSDGPFTRLVPERPQITREQIRATVGPLLTNVMNYPQEISARMLGLDFSGIIVKTTDAIDELVNGAGQ